MLMQLMMAHRLSPRGNYDDDDDDDDDSEEDEVSTECRQS
jgi:hypothetical protein